MIEMPQHIADLLRQKTVCIYQLPQVSKVILYGSYAKGLATPGSDIDMAVFFDTDKQFFLEEYRQLVRICNTPLVDIQVQAFSSRELLDPCGIIEEIVQFGIELSPLGQLLI